MRLASLTLTAVTLALLPGGAASARADPVNGALPAELAWPAPTPEDRPWTRWWWLGSAVDEKNLTRELELFRDAGLGGVEICPVYGVKGWEERSVPFLSARWMELLAHTTATAKRLSLGVDLTTGTGWPFGGPWVAAEDASSRLELARREITDGKLSEPLPAGRPQHVVAVSPQGERVLITSRVAPDGRLDWTGAPGTWRIDAAIAQGPVQKVKRAAPGGEGNVVDPFSVESLGRYLRRFDEAFAGFRGGTPRAHFQDSYEYFGATLTPRLFDEFETRRGYDLRSVLEALFGDGDADTVARVRSDYRETLADLHLDYVRHWTAWAHAKGSLSRNQAHGAPGNLLDLYAAADIPETEVFRRMDEAQLPRLKLASSAAHVSGRPLASAEAFTWLGEHFKTPLSLVKEAADWLLLTGVNHLVFHGIPYSPAGEPWPGWQFYASVHFGPEGGLWRDLPELTAYLTRVQSVLRSGEPDDDVLLYYSPHDAWNDPKAPSRPDDLAPPNPVPAGYEEAGLRLWRRGYLWDAVSERRLAEVRVEGGRMHLGAGRYRALVVPRTRLMPPATLRVLLGLVRQGATVVMLGGPPSDVPGQGALDRRRAELREALAALGVGAGAEARPSRHAVGAGSVLVGNDVEALLTEAGVVREPMVDEGLKLVRRRHARGRHYFVVNRGKATVDGWVRLATPARSAVLLDPLSGERVGLGAVRRVAASACEVHLQMAPGASLVVRTFSTADVRGPAWEYTETVGSPEPLTGAWTVRFLEGGPTLPAGFETRTLASWTVLGDDEARRFAGTARYTLAFDKPAGDAADWRLDLGDVRESERVRLNGRSLGTLWSRPFRVRLGGSLRRGRNTLEIEVTNLAANRIRDLDLRGVEWKRFHDINPVNSDYKPFDASSWPLGESGLLGPVTLARLCAAPAAATEEGQAARRPR